MFRRIFFLFTLFFFCFSRCSDCPKISIITSMYKGERFVEQFLQEIVKQTVFDKCELLIINANSPENEEQIVRRYMERYPNIFYKKLDEDPGLYAVWNLELGPHRVNL